MKNTLKGYLIGVLSTVMLFGCVCYAASNTKTIEVLYNSIKIYVDGVKIDPKDPNGNTVEPFIYNGTTYLPVRAVGEAIGKTVTWDGTTQSVYLGAKAGEKQALLDICAPYDGQQYELHRQTEGKHIVIGGNKYTNAISFWTNWWSRLPKANVLFNLDGKYKSCSFEIGRIDGSEKEDVTLNIYLNGNLEKTYDLSAETVKQKIDINLKNALNMKIEFDEPQKDINYAIINATIE